MSLNGYVNVIGLYGGLGLGKSSYARMIIENFEAKKTLYTYISLTETNEAKDFSELFSERWLETLSERYPKIDVTSYLPFMNSILRESGNGFLSEVLKIISALNRGLARTKALHFDKFYFKNKSFFTSTSVAKLFGNITNIKESTWIIMVDEIERAQFDEIYRLVEIVERFKNEGRSGLPTKLLFLFCISEPDMNNYLDAFSTTDPRARLLKTFFYEDTKSITLKIFLPPIDPAIKQKYVLEKLNKVIERENLDTPEKINPHAISDPSSSFMNNKDATEYIVALLNESTPRTIDRIIIALDSFYGSFKNRMGELQKNSIRFNDIVALEYVKIKYPYLIDFFIKTIHVLINQAERHNIDAYLTKQEIEKTKLDLIGWIELKTSKKIPESEKSDVLKIVGLVMYYYFDFLDKNYETKTKDKYFGTTSYPEVMYDYLTLIAEGMETSHRKNNRIYQKHKLAPLDLMVSLDNNSLLSYSRFLFDVPNSPVQLNISLVKEISNRIVTQKIELDPMNAGDTALDEAIYQFVFQIVAVAEKDKKTDTPSENIQTCFNELNSILSSSVVSTGLKYTVLSSLVNNERGSGSSIHFRLEKTFEKLLRYYNEEIRKLIKFVFQEADNKYSAENKVLYKFEENFFYTLYQWWSGSKDAITEIRKIRNVAKNGLENYPQAIKLYWDRYPSPAGKDWENFNDVIENDRSFSSYSGSNSLFMPLETLITKTKQSKIKDTEIQAKVIFWGSIKDDPRLKELSLIKDSNTTLKSFLIKRGFLDDENKQ